MISPAQTELPLAPATLPDAALPTILAVLDQEMTWLTAAQLLLKIGDTPTESNKRKLRELASASNGKIISGQKGYRHIRHADVDEILHARNWLIHQAKAMSDRASEILHQYHQLPHAPK
jgi:hypothetical protein